MGGMSKSYHENTSSTKIPTLRRIRCTQLVSSQANIYGSHCRKEKRYRKDQCLTIHYISMVFTRKETSMSLSATKNASPNLPHSRYLEDRHLLVQFVSLCISISVPFDTKHLFPYCLIRDPCSLHDVHIRGVGKSARPRYHYLYEKRLSGINY